MRRDRLLFVAAVLGLAPSGCNRQPAAPPGGATPAGPQITVVKPQTRPVKRVVEQLDDVLSAGDKDLDAALKARLDELTRDYRLGDDIR